MNTDIRNSQFAVPAGTSGTKQQISVQCGLGKKAIFGALDASLIPLTMANQPGVIPLGIWGTDINGQRQPVSIQATANGMGAMFLSQTNTAYNVFLNIICADV